MLRKNSIWLLFLGLILPALACQLPATLPTSSTPTATASVSGDVLFYDDFTNPDSGWEHFTSAEGTMDYDGSGYRFLVNALQANFWSTPGRSFRDVRIEVDVAKLAGPDENRIGLICRYSEGQYYFFLVSSDGFYTIGKFLDGQVVQLGQSEMQQSESIYKGLAINHLRADCVGGNLVFYINRILVAQAQDAEFFEGDVGLLAGTFEEPGVDIIFDNFLVLQP